MDLHTESTLEQAAIEDGISRYKKDFEAKQAAGLLTSAHTGIFAEAFITTEVGISDLINTAQKKGTFQQWREDLKRCDAASVTYIGLQALFHAAITKEHIQGLYKRIATDVYWTAKVRPQVVDDEYKVGAQVYAVIMQTGLFEEYTSANRTISITFTDEVIQKLEVIKEFEAFMSPYWRPMVTQPRSITEGSYLEPKLSKQLKAVNTFSKTQKALLEPLMKPETPFVQACDAIQSVPLKINQWILPIIEECYKRNIHIGSVPTNVLPDGVTPSKRLLRSQLKSQQAAFLVDLDEAKKYSNYERVYLPTTMDFRGRVYAKPYLNHQRADYVKALWLFTEGKDMSHEGAVDWLKIHIANCGDFDKVSKAPFSARLKWVNDNFVRIYETVQEPFKDLWWTTADCPFSFLSACRELARFVDVGAAYVCHLPIAIDGSCSGLQHYSAMLRDEEGGKSVNLLPSDKPEDVYRDVAEIVNQLVIDDKDDPIAQEWLSHKIDRKVTKRATMTLCYGSKKFGWTDQLMEDFMSKYKAQVDTGQLDKHPFESPGKASSYMANKLDVALRMTVEKALEGMEWLQSVAGLLAKENKPVIWNTPLGFPVVNEYFTAIEKRLDITINKRRVRTKLMLGFTDQLKASKQRTTIAPNFVHAYDASHLMLVVLESKASGIDNFLLIHDSFGCLPADMEQFSRIVKEQFIDLYKHNDPFMVIYMYAMSVLSNKSKTKLTPPPEKGTLNLNEVMKSNYAFA
jgi:DNA-directed RNA polymerase, mitochondrial